MRFMDFLLRLLCRQTDRKLVNRPETHFLSTDLKHTLVHRPETHSCQQNGNTLLSTERKHTLVNRTETHSFHSCQQDRNTLFSTELKHNQQRETPQVDRQYLEKIARTAIHFLLFGGQSSCDSRSRRPVLPRRKREPAWREQNKKPLCTYRDSYGSRGGLGQSEDLLQDLLWQRVLDDGGWGEKKAGVAR